MEGWCLTGGGELTTIWMRMSEPHPLTRCVGCSVTKVLSYHWQADCTLWLGNLPAGEPVSDTWSTNWAVIIDGHCISLSVAGKFQTVSPFKELEGRLIDRLPTASSFGSKCITVLISTFGVARIRYTQKTQVKNNGEGTRLGATEHFG